MPVQTRAATFRAIPGMQKIILPFGAGFLAALFFHESTLALLHAAGLIDTGGFSTAPFLPSGYPSSSRTQSGARYGRC